MGNGRLERRDHRARQQPATPDKHSQTVEGREGGRPQHARNDPAHLAGRVSMMRRCAASHSRTNAASHFLTAPATSGATAAADITAHAIPSPVKGSTYPAASPMANHRSPAAGFSAPRERGCSPPRQSRETGNTGPADFTEYRFRRRTGTAVRFHERHVERRRHVEPTVFHAHEADVPAAPGRHEDRSRAKERGYGVGADGRSPHRMRIEPTSGVVVASGEEPLAITVARVLTHSPPTKTDSPAANFALTPARNSKPPGAHRFGDERGIEHFARQRHTTGQLHPCRVPTGRNEYAVERNPVCQNVSQPEFPQGAHRRARLRNSHAHLRAAGSAALSTSNTRAPPRAPSSRCRDRSRGPGTDDEYVGGDPRGTHPGPPSLQGGGDFPVSLSKPPEKQSDA